MDDENWFSMTSIGDKWEVETSDQGNYRHRLITNIGMAPRSFGDQLSHHEWSPGRPPDGPHAKK
jgi:hypothetical protein